MVNTQMGVQMGKKSDNPQPGTSTQHLQPVGVSALENSTLVALTEEQLMNNPVLQKRMQKFFTEQFKNIQKDNGDANAASNKAAAGKGSVHLAGHLIKVNEPDDKLNKISTVKSPSDTTIYAPALNKRLTPNGGEDVVFVAPRNKSGVYEILTNGPLQQMQSQQQQNGGEEHFQSNQGLNSITDFVENIRLENHPEDEPGRKKSDTLAVGLDAAQSRAQKAIIEAEKFRASIEPPGRPINYTLNNEMGIEQNIADISQFPQPVLNNVNGLG